MHHQPAPQQQQQHHQIDQYQIHNQMNLMNDQQATYGHQWHHQQPSTDSHMMTDPTFQLQSPNHSNYHHMPSPNQQMLLMQPPSSHQPTQHQQQMLQPQISPQLNTAGNNYIGQSPTQNVQSNENGSTSDDSDDNVSIHLARPYLSSIIIGRAIESFSMFDHNWLKMSLENVYFTHSWLASSCATHQKLIIDLSHRFLLDHAFN
jgi:hypothetical protein